MADVGNRLRDARGRFARQRTVLDEPAPVEWNGGDSERLHHFEVRVIGRGRPLSSAEASEHNELRERLRRYRLHIEHLQRKRHVDAQDLLFRHMTEEQRESYQKNHYCVVRGSKGNDYRLHATGYSGNIALLDKSGNTVRSFCAHLPFAPDSRDIPLATHHLAQLLCLQADEVKFRQTAF